MPIRAETLMGTTVTIEASGVDDKVIDRAFEWFRVVEQVCTRFDPQSELCALARQPGVTVPVSALLFEAVRFAVNVAELSGGAFDPTVGADMQHRGFNREHRSGAQVPPMVERLPGVTYRDVVIDEEHHTITLKQPLLLDLGAVAKGLAIDLAARELLASSSMAIDAGGDLYLGGCNRDGQPWSIGVRHPRLPGECVATLSVTDQAVCTSGDYERGGHILDPNTTSSPSRIASVTVISPSAMLADALGTAAFVLGPDRGLALLDDAAVEGLIVTTDLQLLPTPGWPGTAPRLR